MRKIISVGIIFLLLGVSYILTGCSQKVASENLLAEFGDQIVTLDEFQSEFSELSDREKRKYKGEEGLEEYLLLMAESRMLLETAVDRGLDKDKEIVQQIADYKDQLIVKELVKREVDDKVDVTESHLSDYYEAHKEDYVEPDKVIVTEITVKDEEKAKEVMEKIKGGVDFTELAKEMDENGESSGPSGSGSEGKTRAFSADSYRSAQDFVDTAFALEVNQISDIIVQPMGEDTLYMIVRLDERVPSRQKELSEVEKRIKRIVKKEQKKELMDTWLGKVKAEKKFQLYPERLPEPEPEAEKPEKKAETETEKAETETEKTGTEAEKAGTEAEKAGTEIEKTDEQKTSDEAVEEKSAE